MNSNDLTTLTKEQLLIKLSKCLRALEYYGSAERVLVTHGPRARGAITVKLTKQDNGEIARAALNFDPTKQVLGLDL